MDKIHHLAIQVEDIGKSVDWYKKNFDIQVSYQDETWAMIDFEIPVLHWSFQSNILFILLLNLIKHLLTEN